MTLLRLIFNEIIGLFVDDEKLALSILAVVAACWLIAPYARDISVMIGLLLLIGCLSALMASVVLGTKR